MVRADKWEEKIQPFEKVEERSPLQLSSRQNTSCWRWRGRAEAQGSGAGYQGAWVCSKEGGTGKMAGEGRWWVSDTPPQACWAHTPPHLLLLAVSVRALPDSGSLPCWEERGLCQDTWRWSLKNSKGTRIQ